MYRVFDMAELGDHCKPASTPCDSSRADDASDASLRFYRARCDEHARELETLHDPGSHLAAGNVTVPGGGSRPSPTTPLLLSPLRSLKWQVKLPILVQTKTFVSI